MALNSSSRIKSQGRSLAFYLWLLALIILFIAFVWAYVNYYQTKNKLEKLSTPTGQQELAKQEIDAVVAKVKKLIVLPENEQPTIATITDAKSIAKEQPFYQNAHNGDKVLIYVQAKKAIIYDAANDILVNVGPVFIENPSQGASDNQAVSTSTSTLLVEVRNGSTVKGAGAVLGEELKKNSAFNIVNVDNAANTDYQGYTIVDLSQGKADLLSALQTKLSGAKVVKALPTGEKPTTAEVLVIVGN